MRQHLTLQHVWIRSTRDAVQIFYAVARRVLSKVERRLDTDERRAIVSGNVYVWEERGANVDSTGLSMERWTDGMSWGASRVRDDFLFYQQKDPEAREEPQDPSTRWARTVQRRTSRGPHSEPLSPADDSRPELLVKQTYSVNVHLPEDVHTGLIRKWHLTAYFAQESLGSLYTVDDFQQVGEVTVPEGMFISARVGSRSNRRRARQTSASPPSPTSDPRSSPTLSVAGDHTAYRRRTTSTPLQSSAPLYGFPAAQHPYGLDGPHNGAGPSVVHGRTSRYQSSPTFHPYASYRDTKPESSHTSSGSTSPTSLRTPASAGSSDAFTLLPTPISRDGPRLVPLDVLQKNGPVPNPRAPFDEQLLLSFTRMR